MHEQEEKPSNTKRIQRPWADALGLVTALRWLAPDKGHETVLESQRVHIRCVAQQLSIPDPWNGYVGRKAARN